LTFFIALVALLANFTGEIRGAITGLADRLQGVDFAMSAGLVDLDEGAVSVILSSRRNQAIAISKVVCIVHIPVDTPAYIDERIRRLSTGESPEVRSEGLHWVGQIILSYTLDDPEFFLPFETKLLTFKHALTAFPATDIQQSETEPFSLCTFIGGDELNSPSVAPLLLKAPDMNGLNLDDLLRSPPEDADKLEISKETRDRLERRLKEVSGGGAD
tara:strand:+ start:1007 stop:1654 length:648 start_codon:yes stop_codon:yes gene_type:complete